MGELSIAEQLAVIASQTAGEWRTVLMVVCLVVLAALILTLVTIAVKNVISRFCKLIMWLGPVGCMMCGPFIAKFVVYGSTKQATHLWKFTFGNYVTDNGSYCTNDTIKAIWNFNEAYGGYTFRWCYRDLTMTNEVGVCYDEYHYLPDYLVSASNATATVQNATNMEVVCYAQYVAPVHVVTNGTYHVSGIMRTLSTTNSASPQFATPACPIDMVDEHGNVRTITPTNEPPPVSGTMTIYQTEEE